jgi:Protein of unknown function (DUF2844)
MRRPLLALLCLMATGSARASLGGTADSVEADRRALTAARLPTVARTGYLVHEVEAGGTRVREYLSPAGVVFGVAWEGLAQPDLDTLLGPYAAAWREADLRAPRSPGRRSRVVAAPHLVVEKWGHMRHLQGRAYDPDLLPAGVKADEIR